MDRATILIVEDEETQRSLLAGLLKNEGYTVEEAGTGALAAEIFNAKPIDIVLLDFKLPDMDGLTVLKTLKDINPEALKKASGNICRLPAQQAWVG